jgi:predicted dehydrogenase
LSDLGIGIVGLGFMGRRYARFVSRIEGMRVAGVCDVDAVLADEVAAESGGTVYGDVAAMAAAVDAVIVCTPEHLHLEPALAALDAGKPVMIEKPIAHSLDAARQIATAGKRVGVPVLVGHLLRFEARWVAARQRLDAGAIGDVVSITTRRIGNILDQQVLRGRTSIPLYYGVHDLDVMHWYADAEATSIAALRRTGALKAA